MKRLLTLVASAVMLSSTALQANEPVKQSNYDLPAQFSTERIKTLIHSTAVSPKWIGSGQQFWYSYKTSAGTKYWLVTPAKRERKPLFDEAKMAADLTRITGDPYDAQHLPSMIFKFSEDGKTFKFDLQSNAKEYKKDSTGKVTSKKKEFHFEFDIAAQKLSEVEKEYESTPYEWYRTYFKACEENVAGIKRVVEDKSIKVSEAFSDSASDEPMIPLIEGLAFGTGNKVVVNVLNSGGYMKGLPTDYEVEIAAIVSVIILFWNLFEKRFQTSKSFS